MSEIPEKKLWKKDTKRILPEMSIVMSPNSAILLCGDVSKNITSIRL